jgi:hypothetical protein
MSMYFFHENLVNHALEVFKATEFGTARQGDQFFEIFGPGNIASNPDRPFERFSDYEELLVRLMATDRDKYQKMHKGTPLGFMSWLAFDLRNYEKALFYMDAGISEDVKNFPDRWIAVPGARFLLLNFDPGNPWFGRTARQVKHLLEQQLVRFNGISRQPPLDIDGSWRPFVEKLLVDATQRTIVSALYVFLLEFEDRFQELSLREGSTGGSNQPFTVHLFTGGLLFESLLKRCYPVNDRGEKNKTLGNVLNSRSLWSDFGLTKAPETVAQSLTDIHAAIQGSVSVETALSTAAKLRNTTGHNLVWDDIFSTPAKYADLFHQVMNAILHVISRKLI